MALRLAIDSLLLTPGGRILVFKIFTVEVLLGMSALRMCMGISTARYLRVRGRYPTRGYGAGKTYERGIVIALVRGGIARGTPFSGDICVCQKNRVIERAAVSAYKYKSLPYRQ